MSHFLTFVTDANGVVKDTSMGDDIALAMTAAFSFPSIYIYSHGWWTDESAAMTDYNRFATGYAALGRQMLLKRKAAGAAAATGPQLPPEALAVAIHWPSAITEADGFLNSLLGAASYYTMEKRADDVGETGGYALLRQMLSSRPAAAGPVQINLIGHSFGTKVVCSALQTIAVAAKADPSIVDRLTLRAVLLEGAFSQQSLEQGGDYGLVPTLQNLRVLITRSDEDLALKNLFPFAARVKFNFATGARTAIGSGGPTPATEARFGGNSNKIAVNAGDDWTSKAPFTSNLVIADLTPLHVFDKGNGRYQPSNVSGSHSDIFQPEIYGLIARFLY